MTVVSADEQAVRDQLKTTILTTVRDAADAMPRNRQQALGPSEIGVACEAYLLLKLLGAPAFNPNSRTNWKSAEGTAIHAQLERWISGHSGFETEQPLAIGLGDNPLDGTSDLLHFDSGSVFDWKTQSMSKTKLVRSNGPPLEYRTQIALYGLGFANLGIDVQRTCIVFIPREGGWRDWHFEWSAWDRVLAEQALARLANLRERAQRLGVSALGTAHLEEHYCATCPFYDPAAHLTRGFMGGCPGALPVPVGQPTLKDAA